jgi:Zyg-11 protein homolog
MLVDPSQASTTFQCFPDKDELLRNMMGLLGNVAEVKRLRYRLMTPEYITVFSELLDSNSDGIEVSYNAAGVLAHIASDGAEAWTIQSPSREDVLNRMFMAIERWNLETERNINYRSFEPILGLISCYDTPACQIWAVWALANLTKVSLREEDGNITDDCPPCRYTQRSTASWSKRRRASSF